METSRHKRQRICSGSFAIAAIAIVPVVILWPASVADFFHSQWILSAMAIGSACLAIYLHPEFTSGMAHGIRDFLKASKGVGGDDDDGPRAA
jgi:hypothetical protein